MCACPCKWELLKDYEAKLRYYRLWKHLKIRKRYSPVLYRITALKKTQKSLTRCPVTFVKRDSTADIFLRRFIIFFGEKNSLFFSISQKTTLDHWLQRVFTCLKYQKNIVFLRLRATVAKITGENCNRFESSGKIS